MRDESIKILKKKVAFENFTFVHISKLWLNRYTYRPIRQRNKRTSRRLKLYTRFYYLTEKVIPIWGGKDFNLTREYRFSFVISWKKWKTELYRRPENSWKFKKLRYLLFNRIKFLHFWLFLSLDTTIELKLYERSRCKMMIDFTYTYLSTATTYTEL